MDGFHLASVTVTTAIISFAVSMLIVCSQKWHGGYSHDCLLDGIQKCHKIPVPRIGGLAAVTGVLGALAMFYFFNLNRIAAVEFDSAMALLVTSLPAFAAGITEDLTKKVSVKARLLATVCSALAASALLGATLGRVDIWGIDALLTFFPIALVTTAIVVAGGTNAINIVDGFNGLSGCIVLVMSGALGILAFHVGDLFVATLAALSIGATLGFLMLNYPTGKLFLGDGGAYFLGFWVSEIAVLLLIRNQSINAWQILSICGYPVIEVLYTIYRRKFIQHISPGVPDAMHLHTLIYRRIGTRLAPANTSRTWLRNATVTGVIVPWVAIVAAISVVAGGTIVSGFILVAMQVVLYVSVYIRLAREELRETQAGSLLITPGKNAEFL